MNTIASIIENIPGVTALEVEELRDRVDIIRHKLKFMESRPKVACVSALEPLILDNSLLNEMVNIARGEDISAVETSLTWADVIARDPDVIIVVPEGLSPEESMGKILSLPELPGFLEMKAVKNNRFYIADGRDHFYKSGVEVVDSLEMIAEMINPKLFNFGGEGNGWMKFSF